MISDRAKGVKDLVLIIQCCLVTAGFWAWYFLYYDHTTMESRVNRHLICNAFMLLGLVVDARSLQKVLHLRLPALEETARRSLRQLGVALAYLVFFLVAEENSNISWVFLFSFIPLLFLILVFSNYLLPRSILDFSYPQTLRPQAILLGPVAKAKCLIDWLKRNDDCGLQVAGILTEDQVETTADGPRLLGRPDDLEQVLARPGITEVIIVEFPHDSEIRRYSDICESHGRRLLVVPDLDAIFGRPVALFENDGYFFLGIREEPLETPVNRILKRGLDLAISLPMVAFVLPPLMLFVWIFQRIQSPGPLFFWQLRDGINNEPFNILKFRSMHVRETSDVRLPSGKKDPRLYPAGSFLRKTSLDEIPQFWNVLCGSMSVVGPRPHLKTYNDQYRQVYFKAYVRTLVKPGITGLAQARGYRGDAKTPNEVIGRIESDIEYLENWSFGLDLWLILRTALQMVIPPRGAV